MRCGRLALAEAVSDHEMGSAYQSSIGGDDNHTLDISYISSFYDETISVLWRSLDALWQSDSARVQLKCSECESSTGVC